MSDRLIQQYSSANKYIGVGIAGRRREEGGVTMLNTLDENYLVVQFSDSQITRAWSSRQDKTPVMGLVITLLLLSFVRTPLNISF